MPDRNANMDEMALEFREWLRIHDEDKSVSRNRAVVTADFSFCDE